MRRRSFASIVLLVASLFGSVIASAPIVRATAPQANGWTITPVLLPRELEFTGFPSARISEGGLIAMRGTRNGVDGVYVIRSSEITTVATNWDT